MSSLSSSPRPFWVKSRHDDLNSRCPLCAISGLVHRLIVSAKSGSHRAQVCFLPCGASPFVLQLRMAMADLRRAEKSKAAMMGGLAMANRAGRRATKSEE